MGCAHPGHVTTSSSGALTRASVWRLQGVPLHPALLSPTPFSPGQTRVCLTNYSRSGPSECLPLGSVSRALERTDKHLAKPCATKARAPVGISVGSGSFQNHYHAENICLFFLSFGNVEGTFPSIPGHPQGDIPVFAEERRPLRQHPLQPRF